MRTVRFTPIAVAALLIAAVTPMFLTVISSPVTAATCGNVASKNLGGDNAKASVTVRFDCPTSSYYLSGTVEDTSCDGKGVELVVTSYDQSDKQYSVNHPTAPRGCKTQAGFTYNMGGAYDHSDLTLRACNAQLCSSEAYGRVP